ncbi:DUF6134 family protein [Tenacibaculum sp. 190524A02b]|uniref:GLPGLI family protein n=1 Tax=Tenacibaculum vairaonense TaxID=3137860 RepID=A0ABM9PHS6_9FLAO
MQKVLTTIFLWILFTITNCLYAQTYTYDVIVFGKKIGKVITSKTHTFNEIIYTSDSKSEVSFFGKKSIITEMKTIYKKGVLNTSFYKVTKNNKLKELAEIRKENEIYLVITDGKKTIHSSPVSMSTIVLTYKKPKDGELIFEEVGGYYKKIKKISDTQFDLISDRSRHRDSYYYNEKGILTKCIVRKTLFNFQMILNKEKKLPTSKL